MSYRFRQRQEPKSIAKQKQQQRQEIAIKEALRTDIEQSLEYEQEEEYNPADGDGQEEEEEEKLADDDYEGTAPDDSDEPSSPWDYQWSPWCEDTEFIGFADYVKKHVAPSLLEDLSEEEKKQFFQNLGENVSTPDLLEKWISGIGEEKPVKKVLFQLISDYRFNYPPLTEPGREEVLPAVIVEIDNGKPTVILPDYFVDAPPTELNERRKSFREEGKMFVEILVDTFPDFFKASSFEEAHKNLYDSLQKHRVSQKELAEKWAKLKTGSEDPKVFKSYESRVSVILSTWEMQTPFGDIVPLKFFFPSNKDLDKFYGGGTSDRGRKKAKNEG